ARLFDVTREHRDLVVARQELVRELAPHEPAASRYEHPFHAALLPQPPPLERSGCPRPATRLTSVPMELETFKKLPLGGLDRRALVGALADSGARVARELLDTQRRAIRPAGTRIAPDVAVLILGGSNGITRALALQLLFGERAPIFGVHFD